MMIPKLTLITILFTWGFMLEEPLLCFLNEKVRIGNLLLLNLLLLNPLRKQSDMLFLEKRNSLYGQNTQPASPNHSS
jgi:hypothetical protein